MARPEQGQWAQAQVAQAKSSAAHRAKRCLPPRVSYRAPQTSNSVQRDMHRKTHWRSIALTNIRMQPGSHIPQQTRGKGGGNSSLHGHTGGAQGLGPRAKTIGRSPVDRALHFGPFGCQNRQIFGIGASGGESGSHVGSHGVKFSGLGASGGEFGSYVGSHGRPGGVQVAKTVACWTLWASLGTLRASVEN